MAAVQRYILSCSFINALHQAGGGGGGRPQGPGRAHQFRGPSGMVRSDSVSSSNGFSMAVFQDMTFAQ